MIGKKMPKTWTVPAPIRYVKVTTLYFEEVLLLGLLNGHVSTIFMYLYKFIKSFNLWIDFNEIVIIYIIAK